MSTLTGSILVLLVALLGAGRVAYRLRRNRKSGMSLQHSGGSNAGQWRRSQLEPDTQAGRI